MQMKLNKSNSVRLNDIFLIMGFSLVALGLLIANNGYYSHDELQKLDHVLRYGINDYILQYGVIRQGDAFGTPVRPVAFLIQGGLTFFMESYPVFVHLFAVLMHAIVACLLYVLVLQFGGARSLALASALVFAINPMTILATGWSAALMDRCYVLFGLLALISADRYVRGGYGIASLCFVLTWSALGMLSKETAVILPGLMLLIYMVEPDSIKSKRFWLTSIIWSLPIFLFIGYRLPALLASFGNPTVGAYKASITNLPEGILVYLAYPFIATLTEAQNWIFSSFRTVLLAVGLHLLVTFLLLKAYGLKVFICYWALFFLFLIPVLLIPIKAAHYLYGSSLVLSVGVAALINNHQSKYLRYRIFGGAAALILITHSIILQGFVYTLGTCMHRAMISTESLYLSLGRPASVDFQAEPGAPEHVLHRINTGRDQIGAWYPVHLSVSKWGDPTPKGAYSFIMNNQCLVYTKIR